MGLTVTTRPSGFNAVHLPIIYKLTSDKFPTNSVDTVRTVNTFTNDNGYTRLTLSGTLKTGLQELEFVKLTVNGVSGIYQIYQVFSDSQINIDLEYNGGTTFGSCQYYYANYFVKVRVYAGLRSGHALVSSKPYTLITEVPVVPDSSNVATVNINEILKSDITIFGNNINGLDNDIDSFTEFYIEYAEAYDYSIDGYTLSDFTDSYTSDSANYAIAVNSKLPFKTGGVMSDYVGSTRKFLTLFTQPTIFEGSYYDISFLRETPQTFTQLRRRLYSGDTLLSTQYDTLQSLNEGVYRIQIQKESTEDSIRIDLWSGVTQSETLTINVSDYCSNQEIYITWKNYLGGMDYWKFTAQKEYGIDIEDVTTSTKNLIIDWPTSYTDDSIDFETGRVSRETVVVRAENLDLQTLQALKYIKTSSLVQVITGTENSPLKRNILVDSSSFRLYQDGDKLYSFEFAFKYTDTIPNQSL